MVRRILYLLMAAVCVFYGVSIAALRSGSRFFLVWFALGAGFIGLFFCAQAGLWNILPQPVRAVFLAGVFLGIGITAAAELLVLSGFRRAGGAEPEVLIVLGAQVWPDGPSVSLKYRLDTAAEILKEDESILCIVSGGQGSNEPCTEAEMMAEYLTGLGIAPERILREERSVNTVENIRFSMQLMDLTEKRTGIVTNNFHVYRGTAIARTQGIENAVGIPAPSSVFYLPNNMFREVFGICKDCLKGNMRP